MKRFMFALAGCCLSSYLSAQTTIYTYTGLPLTRLNFTAPCGTGPCANFPAGATITGSFVTANPLPGGLSAANIYPSVTGYSFTDGINTYSSANPNSRVQGFLVNTDAGGNITAFGIAIGIWQTGSSPHAVSDRVAAFQLNTVTPSIGAVNNDRCTAVGVSSAGVTDSCSTGTADASTSQASVQPFASGTWSRVITRPGEYTDVYYNPGESGWGIFVVQSDITQFVALFVYGQDNKPTWYTATLTQDAAGNYTGQLIATTGSYFGSPWNPGQLTVNAVGTIAFQPTDSYHATITYSLNGGPTVMRTVQRQALTDHQLPGSYSGAMSGTQSGCTNPSDNDAHVRATYDLAVARSGGTATLTVTFTDPETKGTVCTIQGQLTLLGRLYRMPNAQLSCTSPDGSETSSVNVEGVHPTGQGIEFRILGADVGGCLAALNFAAVFNN
jgi:hypothetical protein